MVIIRFDYFENSGKIQHISLNQNLQSAYLHFENNGSAVRFI